MTTLPIAICLFTTTKGHFQFDTYAATLNDLHRQIPMSMFGARYAHIKVSVGAEEKGAAMARELESGGFVVERTVADWQRGTSHQQAYLTDMRKASQSPVIQSQPYMILLEDDGTLTPRRHDLSYYLSRMVGHLEADHNLVSTRLIRRCDYEGGVPVLDPQADHFFSPHLDFQPGIYRSRDYLLANKVIEENWERLSPLQCEMVMRIAFDTLSRGTKRHLVWYPDEIETIHLGTPDYPALRAQLNLT